MTFIKAGWTQNPHHLNKNARYLDIVLKRVPVVKKDYAGQNYTTIDGIIEEFNCETKVRTFMS